MSHYRCYIMDENDKVKAGTSIEADDDADALNLAAQNLRVDPSYPVIEVWQGNRIVGRIPQRDHLD